MSEPTNSRKTLRRAIARAERMDFFRRYADGEITLTGPNTTTSLASTALTQSDNHWRNGWAYIASGSYVGQERRITAFAATGDALTLEHALTGAPAITDKAEIFDTWPPSQIHEAINRAIERASRLWPETITSEVLVLKENTLRYLVSTLTRKPFRIHRVWVERVANSLIGTITAVTENGLNYELTVTGIPLAVDQYNLWNCSIMSGDGAGVGPIQDTTTTQIFVQTLMYSSAPAVGDKIRIWDPTYQIQDYYELRNLRLDNRDWPDTLFVEKVSSEFYGCKLHIQYSAFPEALTEDASTTTIPKEYIIMQARAYLHEDLMGDNRSDAARHAQLAQYFQNRADDYMARFHAQRPADSIFIQDNPSNAASNSLDPLGWHD